MPRRHPGPTNTRLAVRGTGRPRRSRRPSPPRRPAPTPPRAWMARWPEWLASRSAIVRSKAVDPALGLVVLALLVDALVAVAMVGRVAEWGWSANKATALGLNLVLLVNLVWSAWLSWGFLRRRRGI